MSSNCLSCGVPLRTRDQIKYCSNKCQMDVKYRLFIEKWKRGVVDGAVGKSTRAISGYVRKYVIAKFDERCSRCGWKERNSITGKVPLEIDHIDGNSLNNAEANLRILCPNCHSLTPHFRALNKGHGRRWRMNKYIKNNFKNE